MNTVDVRAAITRAHHEEWARVVAALTSRFGDLDIAEEAVAEAFATAVQRWPAEGVPPNPGAWLTTTALPAAASGPISVQRKVPADGKVMVARQTLRIGRTYAGNIVTIHVEDTHFRVTLDGAELCIHPRNSQLPVTRWKAKIHAPRL